MSEETGGNPVRARRRETKVIDINSYLKPQFREKSLEDILRRRINMFVKSKYSGVTILCEMLRVPAKKKEIKFKERKMQKKLRTQKISSLLLCMMLIVAMALTTVGCSGDNKQEINSQESNSQLSTESQESEAPKNNVLGEGATKFMFTVVDKDGKETNFEIHTDKETVGDALLEVELIAGEESTYGLYVKTVSGITADYDTDGTYWAFYVNGEYASSGVDSTPVKEGETYSFKVEK